MSRTADEDTYQAVRDYDDTMKRLMHRTTAAGERPV